MTKHPLYFHMNRPQRRAQRELLKKMYTSMYDSLLGRPGFLGGQRRAVTKLPVELHKGEVIRITAPDFTGYDIDVTVRSVTLPIFRDGTVRLSSARW